MKRQKSLRSGAGRKKASNTKVRQPRSSNSHSFGRGLFSIGRFRTIGMKERSLAPSGPLGLRSWALSDQKPPPGKRESNPPGPFPNPFSLSFHSYGAIAPIPVSERKKALLRNRDHVQ